MHADHVSNSYKVMSLLYDNKDSVYTQIILFEPWTGLLLVFDANYKSASFSNKGQLFQGSFCVCAQPMRGDVRS